MVSGLAKRRKRSLSYIRSAIVRKNEEQTCEILAGEWNAVGANIEAVMSIVDQLPLCTFPVSRDAL